MRTPASRVLGALALLWMTGLATAQEPPAEAVEAEVAQGAGKDSGQDPNEDPGEGPGAAETEQTPERPARRRTAFNLPIPEEDGGGTISGTAGSIEFQQGARAVLAGGVELKYQDLTVQAQRVEVDQSTRVVIAEGGVILDEGPRRISGSSMIFDLDAKTGTFSDATAYVDPDYYFSGKEIAKVDADTYTVVNGIFTSCDTEVPAWSFRLKRARVRVGGYAKVRGAVMRVKKLPVFYTPYLLWPAKTDRTSGFLVPQPGYSERRGTSLSLAYFQTLGRSYDTTFFADLYTEDFLGFGNEFRYRPSEDTEGVFEGYIVRDPERNDEWRWRLRLDHTSENLPFGMRAVIAHRDFSDFDYYRDFERDFSRGSLRSLLSRGFASGNWGQHSLNLLAESRETFVSSTSTLTHRKLPEIEYRLRPTRLGKLPLYLTIDSSLSYLDLERSATYAGQYGRADLTPTLTLPIRTVPWLNVSLTAGNRLSWWGDSLCDLAATEGSGLACSTAAREFTGESLTRSIPLLGAEIIGPSFSRIFEKGMGGFDKFKHVIEPRFTYGFTDEFDAEDARRVPLFDEVDSSFSSNAGRFALVNRLLGKRKVEESDEDDDEAGDDETVEGKSDESETDESGTEKSEAATEEDSGDAGKTLTATREDDDESVMSEIAPARDPEGEKASKGGGSAREIALFELAQSYSFDNAQPLQTGAGVDPLQEGPISALLRVNPSDALNLQAQLNYSTLFDRLTSRSLSGIFVLPGKNRVGLTWFTSVAAASGETTGDQLRFFSDLNILPRRVRLETQVNYDLNKSLLQQQRYVVHYSAECFGWRLEFREFNAGQRSDRDFRFSLTLRNVGTFLDLTGRTSNQGSF